MNPISYCSINSTEVIIDDRTVFTNGNDNHLTYFDNIRQHFGIDYPKYVKMDSLSKLGFLTAELLLNGVGTTNIAYSPYECGVIMGNRSSSLNTDLNYWATVKHIPSPAAFVYTLPNVLIAEICIRHGFKGENMFFIAEDFDSSGVREYANMLLDNGTLKFCLYGWVELLKDDYKSIIFAAENKTSR